MSLFVRGDALLSPCGAYRYWLLREWDPTLLPLVICGINPSEADASATDPTLTRSVGFARASGPVDPERMKTLAARWTR